MKKTIAWIILFAMLALGGCGLRSPAAETPQSGETVQIPNPWRDITETEAKSLCPGTLRAPDGAENLHWSAMESTGQNALVQLDFDLNGLSFTAREQRNDDPAADIAGMYYTWTEQTEMTLKNWEESAKSGTYYRSIGEDEWADLCVWYDRAKGVSYSLSVTAKDLDGFDLQAIAEAMGPSPAPAAAIHRQDGERFESVIVLEGMEETVHCEHIRNDTLGLEMDYDYERFARYTDADRERFVSVWDDQKDPENYLELTYRAEDAGTAAAALREALSSEYDLLERDRELEYAGSCLYIEASVLKGTNTMADRLQLIYIIPASDGCIVAREYLAVEASEGFGRRFSYMLNTLSITDRSGEGRLSEEQALAAVKRYCIIGNPELESVVNAGEYPVYWEIASSTDTEIVVLFRSYTGALIRYYVNPVSGETYVTEFVSGITPEEQRTEEIFNVRDYLSPVTGIWQTASIVMEADGTAHPERYVRFTDTAIAYGHMKDGAFVSDTSDPISRFEERAAGGFLVQAEASNGVQYSYRTSESDDDVMEYYETWVEDDFPAMYRGGASLSRCS